MIEKLFGDMWIIGKVQKCYDISDMESFVRVLNFCVSFVAFITASALVLFMLVGFVTGIYDIVLIMMDTVFMDPIERREIFDAVNTQFLHTIAVLIILMKAYRILVEYMRYHHIDIKYIVEIGIIACVLELLFNYGDYTEDMRLILLGLGIGFLAIYAFRYDALKKAMEDTQKMAQKVIAQKEAKEKAATKSATKTATKKVTKRKKKED